MTATIESPYALAARREKAAKLVALMLRHGITAAALRNATVDDWRVAAYAAHVNPPSEATKRMVLADLACLERPVGIGAGR